MAKYDQGGGCACGLYRECKCDPDTAERAAVEGGAPKVTGWLSGEDFIGSYYADNDDNVPVAAQAQPAGPVATLRAAGGLVYLGSPYSLYPDHDEAAEIVAAAAAGLMAQGLVVYSPIAHGHYVSQQGDLPTSWEFWRAQCQPLIDAASAIAVLKMEGWGQSVGLQYEIGEFRRAGKPVVFLDSEAGWREPMDPVEARHDREASRADWEYQFRKEQEAA